MALSSGRPDSTTGSATKHLVSEKASADSVTTGAFSTQHSPTRSSVVPVEPRWRPGGRDFLSDPHEHDFEPVGIVHCNAVHVRVAMPLVRHLLPGQEFLGTVQFGGVSRAPDDARTPASPILCPGRPCRSPGSPTSRREPGGRAVPPARRRSAQPPVPASHSKTTASGEGYQPVDTPKSPDSCGVLSVTICSLLIRLSCQPAEQTPG
jgi:hypothetical protein